MKITLISYDSEVHTIVNRNYTYQINKTKLKEKITIIKTFFDSSRDYEPLFEELFSKMNDSTNKVSNNSNKKLSNRMKSVIFVTGKYPDNNDLSSNLRKNISDNNLYFTFNLFCFSHNFYDQKYYIELIRLRDGIFYGIDKSENETDFINKAMNEIRKSNYKIINITITSNNKYNIEKVYGSNYLTNFTKIGNKISFLKYQFITGMEYSYILEVNLGNDIKYGDRIVFAEIISKELNGNIRKYSNILKYNIAIKYYNFGKKDLCRTLLMNNIESFLNYSKINLYTAKSYFISDINKTYNFCGKSLDSNLYHLALKIKEYFWWLDYYYIYRLLQNYFHF